ncbi:hypothetical protein IGI04_000143 [Brassica rapa subsp. trilocularis]|uniref:NYN domain-containing protein n=1 Tax=Brassica rapa subsp. trilocularis TaxID=1813537 RepID=A0ABQ7NNW9_BRACM|nr:hypothetical protein IGI04_000143 [Brassica rapa subsp. trilocularis]
MSALNRTLSSSMSLKLNTPTPFPIFAFPNSKPSEIRFSNRWGNAQRKVERSLSHSLPLLDHQSYRRRRDQIRCCGMAGGGDHYHVGVWWDLNTCPLPAGVDPRCVRPCIESALEKLFGRRSAVSIYIYAIGNLEFISSDLLQNISSSGIILTHAPCGMHDLHDFLVDWSEDELKNPHPPGYVMIISSDYKLLYPERFRLFRFTTFVAYPKGVRLLAHLTQLKFLGQEFDEVFAKEFVWETLLSDNLDETLLLSDNNTCDEKPLCICNICCYDYEVCDEFITHLNGLKLCTTASLNIFAKFAIIPPIATITSFSITKVKHIIASWLRNRLKKRRIARAGRQIQNWISSTRETRSNLFEPRQPKEEEEEAARVRASPWGVHDLYEFLNDWSDDELKKKTYPPNYIMMISGDYDMLYPQRFRCYGFTNFVAYPENVPVAAPLDELSLLAEEFDKVFAKEFVWETLLSDNLGETLLLSDEKPLCICNICNDVYQVCDEFITHLKSEEHRNQALKQAACIDRHGKPKYFCQVCNYPVYGEYLLFVHNESEEHIRKLVEKQAQEEEDCQSRKTNPELDLFYERNKKQSL